ncbi:MAG: acyl-CoA thioesterase [Microbacteriaceae bacterium]|nr:acyl-CoA thioesterase [Microbacteriaceae bacterium]
MATPTVPFSRDIRICFLGDSFVVGVGDPSGLGWVGRAIAHAATQGTPVTGYNLGVRAETSRDVVRRLRQETEPRLVQGKELRVVLSLGLNDVAVDAGVQRVSTVDTLAAISEAGTLLEGTPVLFVGPPASTDPERNERARELNGAMREHCATIGIPFISTFEALDGANPWCDEVARGDGIHPGLAGYDQLHAVIRDDLYDWTMQTFE